MPGRRSGGSMVAGAPDAIVVDDIGSAGCHGIGKAIMRQAKAAVDRHQAAGHQCRIGQQQRAGGVAMIAGEQRHIGSSARHGFAQRPHRARRAAIVDADVGDGLDDPQAGHAGRGNGSDGAIVSRWLAHSAAIAPASAQYMVIA